MKKVTIILSLVILASCSAKLVKPSQSDADRVATKYPGITVAQLNEGKALYDDKCTKCHPAKNPGSWTEEQWKKIVPAMVAKGEKNGKATFTSAEQESILRYVIAMGPAKK